VGAAAPYGIMLRKDDAPFKKLADATTRALFTSAEFPALCAKWFYQSNSTPKPQSRHSAGGSIEKIVRKSDRLAWSRGLL